MSKMIICKALKYNDELIKNENKEIEFAKKYQILSKNTSLFAEILNGENQQSKLIKVNLNEYKNEPRRFVSYMKPKRSKHGLGMGGGRMMAKCCAAPRSFERAEIIKEKKNINNNVVNFCATPPSPPPPAPTVNMNNKEIKDDTTRIIMKQDIIEGYWEENEDTKKLINIITLDKFNKIKNNVNANYKGPNEIKVIYTVLVIYYLNMKCSERIDEFRLIINKANKFLQKNGIKYENIISGI